MSSPALPGADESRFAPLVAGSVITWVVALGAVLVRVYTRTRIVATWGADDWAILLALFFSVGNSAGQIIMGQFGFGHHVWTLATQDFANIAKTNLGLSLCYQFSLLFSKISILVLYLRVLTYHNARWATYATLVIVVVYNIVGFCIQMTECVPLQKLWDQTVYGTCHPESFLWAVVALHVSTDFFIFALPIPIITNMTMAPKQKLTLVVLFCLGFCACVISIVRAIAIKQILDSPDFTWDFVSISIWTCVEVNIAIVCACLMTLKPLISKLWPRWLPPSGHGVVAELKEVSSSSDNGPSKSGALTILRGRHHLGSSEVDLVSGGSKTIQPQSDNGSIHVAGVDTGRSMSTIEAHGNPSKAFTTAGGSSSV